MLVKMKTSSEDTKKVEQYIKECGCIAHVFQGDSYDAISIYGADREHLVNTDTLSSMPGVEKVMTSGYLLVSRAFKGENSSFSIKDVTFGKDDLVVMAGPCAIESYEQLDATAKSLSEQGIKVLRGGAFKPRTSAYSFQGLGVEGLKIGREIADKYGMLFISELTDARYLNDFIKYVDIIQVGARNAQNFELLKDLGTCGKPILLKQGMADSIDTWLCAAEYIYSQGNERIILCQRGINGSDGKYYRNVCDVNATIAIKNLSHLPICLDPSHSSGKRNFIEPLSCIGAVLGVDALLIEAHYKPECALCDGAQSVEVDNMAELLKAIRAYENTRKSLQK